MIDAFCQIALPLIEGHLQNLLKSSGPLFDAARYSLFSGGKRVRPLLLLAALETYRFPLEKGLCAASALECIHTYSLIHDDLPCMDNDDLRRGKPTLHRVFPEWHALLTGDYLLTFAFEILANSPHLLATQKLDLIQVFSKESGAQGMIGGQMLDLSDVTPQNQQELEKLHAYKTAALFSCALESAAIIAATPSTDRILLKECGTKLGIAFQIHDDLQDACHDQSSNASSLLGPLIAENYKRTLLSEALTLLSTLTQPAPLLSAFIERICL
jgi:geranylgeranyl diphosphate synthase, type II